MSAGSKRIVAILFALGLCVHFLLILNYASPLKLQGKLASAANLYCYPYFYQQWTVFVPAPHQQTELMIRNGAKGQWQPWSNITRHLLKRNRWNALPGRETEVLLMTNAMSYASYDLGKCDTIYTNPPAFMSFKILEHATKQYFRNFRCRKGGKDYELLFITRSAGKTRVQYFKNLSLR